MSIAQNELNFFANRERKIAELTARAERAEKERDALREVLEGIAHGRIDLQYDDKDRPMWHVAFVQLQSLARAALAQTGGDDE